MTTLSVLIVAATLAGQSLEIGVKQSYEKLQDRTNLRALMGKIRDDDEGRITLFVLRNYAGYGRTTPSGPFQCLFVSSTEGRWRFERNSDVILLADDSTRYRFKSRREEVREQGDRIEIMTIELSPEQVQVLAKAKTVEGEIGSERFTLNGEQIAALKEFGEYAADPSKLYVVKDASNPAVVPVAEQIPAGQAVTFIDGKQPSLMVANDPETRLVSIPTNTPVRILGREVRKIGGKNVLFLKAEILQGADKGVVGVMNRNQVILSTAPEPKASAEKKAGGPATDKDKDKDKKAEAQAAAKLKLGTNLEKINPKGAAGYFREAIKLAPGTRVAKEAQDRLDELQVESAKAKEGRLK